MSMITLYGLFVKSFNSGLLRS